MNCFTHGLPFLDKPVFMVGCCVPDWLSAADRKCRAREKLAAKFVDHEDAFVATLAQGIMQHHHDDHWFHQTRAFAELTLELTVDVKEVLDGDAGHRPSLLGHIVIELLLDAYLHQQNPGKLKVYFQQVASVDAKQLQDAVSLIATRPTEKLVGYHEAYIKSKFLFDYADDRLLLSRLNGVMRRVKLPELDERLIDWITQTRQKVYDRATDLLPQYSVPV